MDEIVEKPHRLPRAIRGTYVPLLILPPLLLMFFIQFFVPMAPISAIPAVIATMWGLSAVARLINGDRDDLKELLQLDRDRFAEEVMACLARGDPAPPFTLYLRPFFTDNQLFEERPVTRFLFTRMFTWLFYFAWKFVAMNQREIERVVSDAVQDHAPLIAFGWRDDGLGAGRIVAPEDGWQDMLSLLLDHAERIVMVPIGQPSTLLEIVRIASDPGLLAKTVFIRPHNVKRSFFAFGPDAMISKLSQMWNWTAGQVREILPGFPKFLGGSCLFWFDRSHERHEFHGAAWASIYQRREIGKVVIAGKPNAEPILSIILVAPLLTMFGYFTPFHQILLVAYMVGIVIYSLFAEEIPSFLLSLLIRIIFIQLGYRLTETVMDFQLAQLTMSAIADPLFIYTLYQFQCRLFGNSIRVRDVAALLALWAATMAAFFLMGRAQITFPLPYVETALVCLPEALALTWGARPRGGMLSQAGCAIVILILYVALLPCAYPAALQLYSLVMATDLGTSIPEDLGVRQITVLMARTLHVSAVLACVLLLFIGRFNPRLSWGALLGRRHLPSTPPRR